MGAARSVVVLCVLAAGAHGSEYQEQLARAHFLSGESYYGQQRYADALKEFEEAYRVAQLPAFLYNIAMCHERLDELEPAIANLERYLHEGRIEVKEYLAVSAHIRVLEKTLAARPPAPPLLPLPQGSLASAPRPSSPAAKPPLYRRAWFWGVIGGVAAAAVAGITIGVVLGTRDPVVTLPDARAQ